MAWAIWLGTALLFALIEIATADLIFLMLSGSALLAALSSARFEIAGQFLVAVSASLLLLFLVRPWLIKYQTRKRQQAQPRSLVGAVGTALDQISLESGLARINGEVWTARSVDVAIPHGTSIMVVRIEGTTMVVRAND